MKIRFHSLLGTFHSWALVLRALSKPMRQQGHSVFLKSTNGLEHFPDELKPYLLAGYHNNDIRIPEVDFINPDGSQVRMNRRNQPYDLPDHNRPYDLELAYTVFFQIPRRFFRETTCKMDIWNFESSIIPEGWAEYHRGVDYILPSSQYCYDLFLKNGVPASKMVIVPLGVDRTKFHPEIPPFKLHTQKKVKILLNAIPHGRKLIDRAIDAYLEAFTGDDDVCLVMKTQFLTASKEKPFEVDVQKILEDKLKGRNNPPEIEILTSFVPDIGSLYTACDVVLCTSAVEGFGLPNLEALACGCPGIAPRYGGQLDFLNDDNAMLIDTGEMKAPISMQYWTYHPDAVVGDPSTRHCAELLRKFYENPQAEKDRIAEAAKKTVEKFSWEAAAKQITDLAEEVIAKKHHIATLPKPTPKRSVMYVVPYPMAGGGEVWIRETIKRLDRNRYEPRIVFPLGTNPRLSALFEDLNVTIDDLKDRGTGKALRSIIEADKPDIVHFYNSLQTYGVLVQTLQEGGWHGKLVETVHSDLVWPDSMTKVAARRGVSLIIGISENICAKMARIGNKNVHHLSQYIDWNRFLHIRDKTVLEEISCRTDKFIVGTVARLSPEKNIPIILSCAKALPDITFVVVGDGPQASILKKMAAGISNVMFVGQRTDVERFYAAFDVFLLPSAMEGLPLSILEALASGVPVVASNVGAVGEAVLNGHNGFLIQGGPQAYVEAISNLRNLECRNTMSANALSFTEMMKARSMSKSITSLYDSLGG